MHLENVCTSVELFFCPVLHPLQQLEAPVEFECFNFSKIQSGSMVCLWAKSLAALINCKAKGLIWTELQYL